MEISYFGHSSFRIKTKTGIVVMDPFGKEVGMSMPKASCDVVTISHRGHGDHDNESAVSGTARRKEPFVIDEAGEYEIEGISVFGYQTYHDDKKGQERGENTIFIVQAEDLRVLHLGDLGHILSDRMINTLESVDVVMIPVGGVYTIDSKKAVEVLKKLEPSYVIPMHYKTDKHNMETFKELEGVDKFVELYDHPVKKVESLKLSKLALGQDAAEVVLFE